MVSTGFLIFNVLIFVGAVFTLLHKPKDNDNNLSTPETRFQSHKLRQEKKNQLAYPESPRRLQVSRKFSKQETEDSYMRLVNNIRKEINEFEYSKETHETYVWGEFKPITVHSTWSKPKTSSRIKYYVSWDKYFKKAYFVADSIGRAQDADFTMPITEEEYSAAYVAAKRGMLDWEIVCEDVSTFVRYVQAVKFARHIIRYKEVF